jgi:hypothetical protein
MKQALLTSLGSPGSILSTRLTLKPSHVTQPHAHLTPHASCSPINQQRPQDSHTPHILSAASARPPPTTKFILILRTGTSIVFGR